MASCYPGFGQDRLVSGQDAVDVVVHFGFLTGGGGSSRLRIGGWIGGAGTNGADSIVIVASRDRRVGVQETHP